MPDLSRADAVDASSTSLVIKIRQAFNPVPERFTPLSDLAKAFCVKGEITSEVDANDWRLADPDLLMRNEELGGMLLFMDGPTWRHYLPIWLTVAATHGEQLKDLASAVVVTLDPKAIVLADDPARFVERTSVLTDAQRAVIAYVLAIIASFSWIRAKDKNLHQVDGLIALWGQGTVPRAGD